MFGSELIVSIMKKNAIISPNGFARNWLLNDLFLLITLLKLGT